jgi:hypothetical protein
LTKEFNIEKRIQQIVKSSTAIKPSKELTIFFDNFFDAILFLSDDVFSKSSQMKRTRRVGGHLKHPQ